MSHPVPGHSYGEDQFGDNRKPKTPKHKTIKDLKQMVSEPASKEWFAKHGLPKSKYANQARTKALSKKMSKAQYNKERIQEEKDEARGDFENRNN